MRRHVVDTPITLKVRASSQEFMTEFVVVDIASPYNAIWPRLAAHDEEGGFHIILGHQVCQPP